TTRPSATTSTTTTPTTQPPRGVYPSRVVVSDLSGDTQDDNYRLHYDGNADVLETTATHRGVDIVLTVRVSYPSDPATTHNWESPYTFADWEIDTEGDGLFDYQVHFRRGASGRAVVDVYRVSTGSQICSGTAGLGPQREYTATVPIGCVGNATAFWWQSFMIWDTNPDNPSAVKDHDNAPENGSPHAGPVGAP